MAAVDGVFFSLKTTALTESENSMKISGLFYLQSIDRAMRTEVEKMELCRRNWVTVHY